MNKNWISGFVEYHFEPMFVFELEHDKSGSTLPEKLRKLHSHGVATCQSQGSSALTQSLLQCLFALEHDFQK